MRPAVYRIGRHPTFGGLIECSIARCLAICAIEESLIDPATIGLIFAIKGAFNGTTDPLAGWLSDRKHTPRRPSFYRVGIPFVPVVFRADWS